VRGVPEGSCGLRSFDDPNDFKILGRRRKTLRTAQALRYSARIFKSKPGISPLCGEMGKRQGGAKRPWISPYTPSLTRKLERPEFTSGSRHRNPMLLFVFDGVLFRLSAKRPSLEPLFQLPPANAPRAPRERHGS
jgi:hypothetical protein